MNAALQPWVSCLVLLTGLFFPLDTSGQYPQASSSKSGTSNHYLTQILIQRLLGNQERQQRRAQGSNGGPREKRRKAVEDLIYGKTTSEAKIVYPQGENIRRYLDEAKDQIDVIDFRQPIERSDWRPNNEYVNLEDELAFGADDFLAAASSASKRSSASSDHAGVKLSFPGNEFNRPKRSDFNGCTNCVDGGTGPDSRWTMPLQKLGEKQYYLGIFFKANWYKAEQYCRFHGMHLASINTADEQRDLQEHIQAYGMGHEHFWTSGTDQGEEGKFFWMGTGKPITYQNWNAGEPNNFEYEDGEQEHCLEMWDRDGKGLGWNDTPCSFSTFFICEA